MPTISVATTLRSRYVDPKTDMVFKLIFANDTELLASFLNALLPLEPDAQIQTIEYLSPEQIPQIPGMQKRSILDVKCQDQKGRIFIVEMQMYWSASFAKRIVFEASQAYVSQALDDKRSYSGLNSVYALALTNTAFIKNSDEYYHHYKIIHTQDPRQVLEGLEFVFIEIPKFKPQTQDQKRMAIKWLRFMREVGDNDASLDDEMLGDPLITKALGRAEIAALNPQQLHEYNRERDKIALDGLYASDARQEGEARGLARGLIEGEARGKAEALRRLIVRRFGSIGPNFEQRITQATLEQLDAWFNAGIDAPNIEAVFASH